MNIISLLVWVMVWPLSYISIHIFDLRTFSVSPLFPRQIFKSDRLTVSVHFTRSLAFVHGLHGFPWSGAFAHSLAFPSPLQQMAHKSVSQSSHVAWRDKHLLVSLQVASECSHCFCPVSLSRGVNCLTPARKTLRPSVPLIRGTFRSHLPNYWIAPESPNRHQGR